MHALWNPHRTLCVEPKADHTIPASCNIKHRTSLNVPNHEAICVTSSNQYSGNLNVSPYFVTFIYVPLSVGVSHVYFTSK